MLTRGNNRTQQQTLVEFHAGHAASQTLLHLEQCWRHPPPTATKDNITRSIGKLSGNDCKNAAQIST